MAVVTAPAGFVCLQCWRVWTADGQPETNPWELARAGLEIRLSAIQGPTTGPDGHCDVCDDGKKGPDMQEYSVVEGEIREMLTVNIHAALLREMQRQNNDDTIVSAFTVRDQNGNATPLDFSGLAESAVAEVVEFYRTHLIVNGKFGPA